MMMNFLTEFLPGIVTGIVTGAPIWIWPLLFLLIGLGIFCSRDRKISILPYFLMPLIALTTVPILMAQQRPELAVTVWGLAYLCGILGGYRLQGRWTLSRTGLRAEVTGEWLSLCVMMLLFWANFANGVFAAVAPDLTAGLVYQILFPALLGLASGSFLGRPLRILTWPSTRGAALA
jgi:hypothetical protein